MYISYNSYALKKKKSWYSQFQDEETETQRGKYHVWIRNWLSKTLTHVLCPHHHPSGHPRSRGCSHTCTAFQSQMSGWAPQDIPGKFLDPDVFIQRV